MKIPAMELERDFWQGAGDLVATSIYSNIIQGKKADGGNIKRNSPKTTAKKRKEGKRPISLVDEEHRFITPKRSWGVLKFLTGNKGVVVGANNEELKQLIRYTGLKGYGGYVGLSRQVKHALGAYLREYLTKKFRSARGKVR